MSDSNMIDLATLCAGNGSPTLARWGVLTAELTAELEDSFASTALLEDLAGTPGLPADVLFRLRRDPNEWVRYYAWDNGEITADQIAAAVPTETPMLAGHLLAKAEADDRAWFGIRWPEGTTEYLVHNCDDLPADRIRKVVEESVSSGLDVDTLLIRPEASKWATTNRDLPARWRLHALFAERTRLGPQAGTETGNGADLPPWLAEVIVELLAHPDVTDEALRDQAPAWRDLASHTLPAPVLSAMLARHDAWEPDFSAKLAKYLDMNHDPAAWFDRHAESADVAEICWAWDRMPETQRTLDRAASMLAQSAQGIGAPSGAVSELVERALDAHRGAELTRAAWSQLGTTSEFTALPDWLALDWHTYVTQLRRRNPEWVHATFANRDVDLVTDDHVHALLEEYLENPSAWPAGAMLVVPAKWSADQLVDRLPGGALALVAPYVHGTTDKVARLLEEALNSYADPEEFTHLLSRVLDAGQPLREALALVDSFSQATAQAS